MVLPRRRQAAPPESSGSVPPSFQAPAPAKRLPSFHATPKPPLDQDVFDRPPPRDPSTTFKRPTESQDPPPKRHAYEEEYEETYDNQDIGGSGPSDFPTSETTVDGVNEEQTGPDPEGCDADVVEEARAGEGEQEEEEKEHVEGEIGSRVQEPDWAAIAAHPPSSEDVPLFLAARDRRIAAETAFSAALDEVHDRLNIHVQELLAAAAEVYNVHKQRFDEMEEHIISSMTHNDRARREMEVKLNESAERAHSMFQKLLMRVTGPLVGNTSRGHGSNK